ncbi:ABC transporter permease [Lactobacillus sp. ESL0236]|uniref:ABC transporter permease n=1 Tax=unclassified Lactobacillus TaxID=2620435 RepID=UPI000EFA89AB|nr:MULTISPECIES: ABC transporter permease [unclassified Lactobacillus]RMC39157.1 ABC transporter permease [Lactobacillus sp. ESL0237]RMC43440.1 ABC transporter permease [Lactobacillus sp. ESL0234]RMC44352.1 ABC transporter permease [Lactobacillus sp. ESL0236]
MQDLAKNRLQKNLQQSLKYLTLVFNDFFILAIIFLLGALMFWYAQSMKKMPPNLYFYKPLVGLILSMPLLIGKLVTLLQAADIQFLLPQDKNMRAYLKMMRSYSLLVPLICLVLIAGILFPFALIKAKISILSYCLAVLAVFLAKIAQLKVMEYNLFYNKKISLFLVNTLFFITFAVLMMWPKTMFLVVILLAILISGATFKPQNAALFDWQYAVELEQRRKNQVYGVFSMFTDVKERKVKIRRRKYLDFLLPNSLRNENPNKFLYRRALLRNPENLNLLVRMTAFAGLISLLVQNWLWALTLCSLVVFLTVYQLLPMANEFDNNIMYQVYPIEHIKRGQDLLKVLSLALFMQWVIISIFWLLILPVNLQLFEASSFLLLFSWLIAHWYLPWKVKQRKI